MLTTTHLRRHAAIGCVLLLCALQNVYAQRVRPTTDLPEKRAAHESVTLPGGKVLIIGGQTTNTLFQPVVYNTCLLFDPITEQWSPAASMNEARRNFAALLTPDGNVLAIGGSDATDTPLSSVERYNPANDTWTTIGNLNYARQNIDAIVMEDSTIIVVGHEPVRFESSADGAHWTLHEFQSVAWRFPASPGLIKLNDGRVLCAGNQPGPYPNWAIIFDGLNPDTAATPLFNDHPNAGLALLPNGKVLVIGGRSELFDPATNTFSSTGAINSSHSDCPLMPLPDGRVAIFNVGNTFQDIILEIYDPAFDQWNYQTGHNFTGTDGYSAAPISVGKYLISGGRELLGQATTGSVKAFVFDELTATGDKLAASSVRVIYDMNSRWLQVELADHAPHRIALFSADGKMQAAYLAAGQQFSSALPLVAAGVYLLQISDASGKSVFSKSLFIR